VSYYGSSCYNCRGLVHHGAAAAASRLAWSFGAAVASANTAAATSSAYAADYTAKHVNTAYAMGAIHTTLPASCVVSNAYGTTYYNCSNTWFQPSYGANGVYYRVVPTP
jgi:hypothetical protein